MAQQVRMLKGTAAFKNNHSEKEYFENSYSLIGLKDYMTGTRITPNVAMKLQQARKVSLAAATTNGAFMPYNNQVIKELKKGYLPVVTTDIVIEEALRYRTEMFVGPLKNAPLDGMDTTEENYINYLHVTMGNVSAGKQTAAMRLDITEHFSTEVASVRDLQLRDNGSHKIGFVNGQVLFILKKQDNVKVAVENAALVITAELPSKAEAAFEIRFAAMLIDDADLLRPEVAYETALQEVEQFWENFLNQGTQIELPNEKAINTLKASIVYTFITRDRGEIHPGEEFYDLFWVRDAVFINYSIQMMNFTKDAYDSLDAFWKCTENEDGSLMSHEGQLDGTGQGLWGLYQYYKLSRDDAWLTNVYPRLKRAADWILNTRRKDLPICDPYYGLMPNSLADGECLWDGQYHIVGYDLWSLRGLKCFAELAEALGKHEDAAKYMAEFEHYKKCVLNALDRAGVDYFPPSYELKGTHWSNIKSVFPTPIIDPMDPRVSRTMDEAEKTFVEGVCGWAGTGEDMGEIHELPMKAIHPYMSTYVTQTRLVQGDYKKVYEHFQALLEHTTSTHGFPEGIFYEYRLAWNDLIPHIYGAATYIILLRRMLIHDEGKTLHLGLGTPSEWLTEGEGVQVRNALTEFGVMSYEAKFDGQKLRAKIEPPTRNEVKEINFYVPDTLAGNKVTVNGEEYNGFDGRKITIPSHLYKDTIIVEVE